MTFISEPWSACIMLLLKVTMMFSIFTLQGTLNAFSSCIMLKNLIWLLSWAFTDAAITLLWTELRRLKTVGAWIVEWRGIRFCRRATEVKREEWPGRKKFICRDWVRTKSDMWASCCSEDWVVLPSLTFVTLFFITFIYSLFNFWQTAEDQWSQFIQVILTLLPFNTWWMETGESYTLIRSFSIPINSIGLIFLPACFCPFFLKWSYKTACRFKILQIN